MSGMIGAIQGRLERLQRVMFVPQRVRRLGRGHIQDDDLFEMVPVAKGLDIALDALDCLGRRANLIYFGKLAQGTDSGAALDNRSRSDIARPRGKICRAMSYLLGRENIGSGVQIADGIEKSVTTNVVPAHNERIERIKRHIGEKRSGRDDANRRLDAARDGGQAQRGRAAHTTAGANQP